MKWQFNDGGRSEAGYKGSAGDCVVRAVCIATGKSYRDVYDTLNGLAQDEKVTKGKRSNARTGVKKKTFSKYLESLGWKWTPTMGIGTGCKVHLSDKELPLGTVIVRVSGHIATVIDGVLHDTYDCTRGMTRCVYGYWTKD